MTAEQFEMVHNRIPMFYHIFKLFLFDVSISVHSSPIYAVRFSNLMFPVYFFSLFFFYIKTLNLFDLLISNYY